MHPYQRPEGSPPRPAKSDHTAALASGREDEATLQAWWKPAAAVLLLVGVAVSWMQVDRNLVQHSAAGDRKASDSDRQSPGMAGHDLVTAFFGSASGLSDEEYRLAAIAWDEQKRAERAAANRRKEQSKAVEPRRHWKRRVKGLQQIIASHKEFPEGSIQWHARESLRQTLADAPR